jgi:hypothetical protein
MFQEFPFKIENGKKYFIQEWVVYIKIRLSLFEIKNLTKEPYKSNWQEK